MPPESRIAELLAPGMPEWLRAGVLEWLQTGAPLHQCLGIARADSARVLRDFHLVRAWLTLDDALSPWARCLELADLVLAFETRAWPRLKSLSEPDPRWSAQRTELWLAFHYAGAVGVPGTARMLSEIVKSSPMAISQLCTED